MLAYPFALQLHLHGPTGIFLDVEDGRCFALSAAEKACLVPFQTKLEALKFKSHSIQQASAPSPL